MRKHIGRVVAGVSVAAAIAGATAGVALAASSGTTTGQPVAAAKVAAAEPLTKTTMPVIAKKLGVSQDLMIKALDDAKEHAVDAGKGADVKAIMVKILATDAHISGESAQWVIDEITGGYVDTRVNWGF
jgi:hypothetical protein